MTLVERLGIFRKLFYELQLTTSRLVKEQMLAYFKNVHPDLQDDLNYIFETLAGKHPIGWTFYGVMNDNVPQYNTIRECIKACEDLSPKTAANTAALEMSFGFVGVWLMDIMNRTLRLGIGRSQLTKDDFTPMLAKKYEGQLLRTDVFVTEKLDGNRCIAHYDGEKWCFTSRSGKPLNVNFDMTGLDTAFIYDGEIMSVIQTEMSDKRYQQLMGDGTIEDFGYDTKESQLLFNQTSGLVNRHGVKSGLIYNIFDIINDDPYVDRRSTLQSLDLSHTNDVRLLPILYVGTSNDKINALLDSIVRMGGEGVMLNLYDAPYMHKRTDALLKYKQVQYVDMQVLGLQAGAGKYTGMVGALICYLLTDDGKHIWCEVGTGLSDAQRLQWAQDKNTILGKIVQIGYHELTQEKDKVGSNLYSLRFPRLIKVRYDKDETSQY